jgi:hypothetical protein
LARMENFQKMERLVNTYIPMSILIRKSENEENHVKL